MKLKSYLLVLVFALILISTDSQVLGEEEIHITSFDTGLLVFLNREIDVTTLGNAILKDADGNVVTAALSYDKYNKTISAASVAETSVCYSLDLTEVKYTDGTKINNVVNSAANGMRITGISYADKLLGNITSIGTSGATNITAKAALTNLGESKDITAVLGVFDEKQLIYADLKNVSILQDGSVPLVIDTGIAPVDGSKLKLFLWDNETMYPYSNVFTLPTAYPAVTTNSERIYTTDIGLDDLNVSAASVSKTALKSNDAEIKDIYYFPSDNSVTVDFEDNQKNEIEIFGEIKLCDDGIYNVSNKSYIKQEYRCENELCSIAELQYYPVEVTGKQLLLISMINPHQNERDVILTLSGMEEKQIFVKLPSSSKTTIGCFVENDVNVAATEIELK